MSNNLGPFISVCVSNNENTKLETVTIHGPYQRSDYDHRWIVDIVSQKPEEVCRRSFRSRSEADRWANDRRSDIA
jgi:hypothetical protein